MTSSLSHGVALPGPTEIRQAVLIYLRRAYGNAVPDSARQFVPPEAFDPAEWLMGPQVERDPPDARLEGVRSFALRLGNRQYPHMKLRLSRPPSEETFLLSVDAHDAFLFAPAGSADASALEAMKRTNAAIAAAVLAAWDAAGLPTERNYLRRKIREAQGRNNRSGLSPSQGDPRGD